MLDREHVLARRRSARFRRRLEIVDEGILERAGAAGTDESDRRIGRQHPPRIHQRDPVAARRFVHEVRGDEDGDALIAGKIDQQFPEGIARHRIHAGGRLIENEEVRLVHDRDRQRQALADAERQGRCQLADIVAEAETANEAVDAMPGLVARQMKQARVEVEVLANRELGIERECLRHVAHARA